MTLKLIAEHEENFLDVGVLYRIKWNENAGGGERGGAVVE